MMVKKTIFCLLTCLLWASCQHEDSLDTLQGTEDAPSSSPGSSVTFTRSGDSDDVSILVFQSAIGNVGTPLYAKKITPAWVKNNATDKYDAIENFELSRTYQFLFYKYKPVTSSLSIESTSKFEDVTFKAAPDGTGYVKPVDDLFLPENWPDANKTYSFLGDTRIKVSQTLVRVVGKVDIEIKRGAKQLDQIWHERPYTDPTQEHVLQNFDQSAFEVEIEGVGHSLSSASMSIGGTGIGSVKTKCTSLSFVKEETKGFAFCDGPLLFPNEDYSVSKITITYKKLNDTKPKKVTVQDKIQPNVKTVVTLWIDGGSTIDISVSLKPMEETDGASGLWGGGTSR